MIEVDTHPSHAYLSWNCGVFWYDAPNGNPDKVLQSSPRILSLPCVVQLQARVWKELDVNRWGRTLLSMASCNLTGLEQCIVVGHFYRSFPPLIRGVGLSWTKLRGSIKDPWNDENLMSLFGNCPSNPTDEEVYMKPRSSWLKRARVSARTCYDFPRHLELFYHFLASAW